MIPIKVTTPKTAVRPNIRFMAQSPSSMPGKARLIAPMHTKVIPNRLKLNRIKKKIISEATNIPYIICGMSSPLASTIPPISERIPLGICSSLSMYFSIRFSTLEGSTPRWGSALTDIQRSPHRRTIFSSLHVGWISATWRRGMAWGWMSDKPALLDKPASLLAIGSSPTPLIGRFSR